MMNTGKIKRAALVGIILFLLTLCSTQYFYNQMEEAKVKAAYTYTTDYDTYQIMYTQDGKQIYRFEMDNDNSLIRLSGTHAYNMAAKISYETYGFTLANQSTPDGGNGKTSKTSYSNKGFVNTKSVTIRKSENTGITTYTIADSDYTDFISTIQKIFKDQEEALTTTGVTMYMSSAYNVGNRHFDSNDEIVWETPWIKSGIVDLDKMLAAADWSEGTKEVLPNYYDMKFNIRMAPYKTVVNYEDTKGNIIKSNVRTIKPVYLNKSCSDTLTETAIIISGKNYTYAKKATISYGPTEKSLGYKSTITWTHDTASDAVLTYYFDLKEDPVNVVLEYYLYEKAIDRYPLTAYKTKAIGTATVGSTFTYDALPATIWENSTTYTYQKKWNYVYTDKQYENEQYSASNSAADPFPDIDIVPEVKKDTKLRIRVYYKPGPTPAGTITPKPTGTITPSPTAVPVPTTVPSSDEEAPYPEYYSLDMTFPVSTAVIWADNLGNSKYDSQAGIPTQESLYTQVSAATYLVSYDIEKAVGTITYPITVKQAYTLTWKTEKKGADGKIVTGTTSETVNLSTVVYVKRAYGYWEINSFRYYTIQGSTINNYALPNGFTYMTPGSAYAVPSAYSNDLSVNITKPVEATSGITLDPVTITSSTKTKPSIPNAVFEAAAYNAAQKTGKIKVQDDTLTFNGITIMDSSVQEYNTPSINPRQIHQPLYMTYGEMLYNKGLIIDAWKLNGIYASDGSVTYQAHPASINLNTTSITRQLDSVNSVTVHTPVYCDGSIISDNNQYVQLQYPTEDVAQLVLDEVNELNDFTVKISNFGIHSTNLFGYAEHDYSKILRDPLISNIAKNTSGILQNEVSFPFPCYMDVGNDDNTNNDILIPVDTWTAIGTSTQRFYTGMTAKEGVYLVQYRSVAVNAQTKMIYTEDKANRNRENYVATDSELIQISGRMYGLTIYDITDYPVWEETFRKTDTLHLKRNLAAFTRGTSFLTYFKDWYYDYSVGTMDSYGRTTGRIAKYTFPLVAGSHPYYTNMGILKKGYAIRFTLDTVGSYYEDGSTVEMTPKYYHVDENGQNRREVDLYYKADINGKSKSLLKAGSATDLLNQTQFTAGNRYLGIPEQELVNTAALRNITTEDWRYSFADMMCVGNVKLGSTFRTYVNQSYATKVLSSAYGFADILKGSNQSLSSISRLKQRWYGTLYIPGTSRFCDVGYPVYDYAKKYGIDYTESFWKEGGYIIVNIEIKVTDKNGKTSLLYVNQMNAEKYCSMWNTESGNTNTETTNIGTTNTGTTINTRTTTKTGTDGTTFTFEPGDFIIYDTDAKISDDYSIDGIY